LEDMSFDVVRCVSVSHDDGVTYESGFQDRVISLKISAELAGIRIRTKKQFEEVAKKRKDVLMEALSEFPTVFSDKMIEL
jgi:POLQ-like helicase